MTNDSGSALGRMLRGLVTTVLSVVLAVAGLLFVLVLMGFGVVAGTLLVLWALLRGRRPQGLRFGVPPGARWNRFDARFNRGAPGARASRGEVVDVEAREVTTRGPTNP